MTGIKALWRNKWLTTLRMVLGSGCTASQALWLCSVLANLQSNNLAKVEDVATTCKQSEETCLLCLTHWEAQGVVAPTYVGPRQNLYVWLDEERLCQLLDWSPEWRVGRRKRTTQPG